MAAANANADNWEWHAESTEIWEFGKDCQEFNTRWYGTLHDPKSPSLSLGPLSALGNFPSEILVRECYGTMFDRVWANAMDSEGKVGSLITGQPGTGKTLFLFYLLVRLLQLRQVVLLTLEGHDLYLFYHGKVYTSTMTLLYTTQKEYRLPQPKSQTSNVFIWSLFDIREKKAPDALLITQPCLPVQAASPDPIRFKMWRKEFRPMCAGMPLWTHDELIKGLPYQSRYNSLLDALRKHPSQYETDPLERFPGTRELVAEFQAWDAAERDIADDTAARIADDAGVDTTHATTPFSPEDALDYILGAAIDRFGYSARDVFAAVFNYKTTTAIHEEAFMLTPTQLEEAFTFPAEHVTSAISHMIIALSPVCSNPYSDDRWTVNFKSDWVARGIIQRIDVAERDSICQRFLQQFPPSERSGSIFS